MPVMLPFRERAVPVDGNLLVELTKRCNYRCVHCYADAGPGMRGPEPTAADVLALARSAQRLGFRAVTLSGGEPLLYRELPAVVDGWPAGLDLWLFTSGIRIDIDRLVEWSSTVVGYAVSLDGPRARHNRVRQSARSFDDIIGFLRLLGATGRRTHLQSMVLRGTTTHVEPIVELCEAIGIERVLFSHVSPHGRGVELVDEQMPAEDLDALFRYVQELQATTPVKLSTNLIPRTGLAAAFPDPVVHVVGDGTVLPWFGAPSALAYADVSAAGWDLEAAVGARRFPAVVDRVFTRARARAEAYEGDAVPVDDLIVEECAKVVVACS